MLGEAVIQSTDRRLGLYAIGPDERIPARQSMTDAGPRSNEQFLAEPSEKPDVNAVFFVCNGAVCTPRYTVDITEFERSHGNQ